MSLVNILETPFMVRLWGYCSLLATYSAFLTPNVMISKHLSSSYFCASPLINHLLPFYLSFLPLSLVTSLCLILGIRYIFS